MRFVSKAILTPCWKIVTDFLNASFRHASFIKETIACEICAGNLCYAQTPIKPFRFNFCFDCARVEFDVIVNIVEHASA